MTMPTIRYIQEKMSTVAPIAANTSSIMTKASLLRWKPRLCVHKFKHSCGTGCRANTATARVKNQKSSCDSLINRSVDH